MKYLFINSVAGLGSTGRIAAEKCRELMAQGHECLLCYGRDMAHCEGVPTLRIGSPTDYRLHGIRSRIFDDQGFGSAAATREFVAAIREFDPDVIWLHNIHGYYLHVGILFDYLRTCGKKIIWTLHDCWAFTGHCAYFDYVGCDRWKSGCCSCPQKGEYPQSLLLDSSRRNYEKKKALFTGIPELSLTVPSQWLADRVKQSFLKDYPVEVIYNTVDRTVFHRDPGDFRSRYGLEDKRIVLGVANVWDRRKGLEDFCSLSGMLPEDYRIVLIGLSEQQIRSLPGTILGLPRTSCVEELVHAYSSADVYVTPSTEETFGMTVLEAECCGTRAVVYEGTACEEVALKFGGIAVPRGAANLARAILELTEDRE